MKSDMEQLLEKWISAIKKYGHMVDVYKNPSKSEFMPISKAFRFIMDAKNKTIYVWDANGAIHADVWTQLKQDIGDTRGLYKSEELLTGTVEGTSVNLYAASSLHSSIREGLKKQDWSFASKYVDMTKLEKVLKRI